MPRTEIKRHWLWGSRLVTVYTDNDRMLQKLGRKLGIDLLKLGPNVTKVLVEDGEVVEIWFKYNEVSFVISAPAVVEWCLYFEKNYAIKKSMETGSKYDGRVYARVMEPRWHTPFFMHRKPMSVDAMYECVKFYARP